MQTNTFPLAQDPLLQSVEAPVQPPLTLSKAPLQPEHPPTIISDAKEVKKILSQLRRHVWKLALTHIRNPFSAYKAVKKLVKIHRQYMGKPMEKLVTVGGRYYFVMGGFSWPSASFNAYILEELNRVHPFRVQKPALRSVYMAITKKCPLACEHCFEGPNLNKKERLSLEDLHQMVRKFQQEGVMQIQLSGGEPMLRYDDMLELIPQAQKETDFWMISSGYQLTTEKAQALKAAGMLGVSISLDHFDPEKHNHFRRYKHSFGWVMKAADSVRKAEMVLCLNLCATKEFVTDENLFAYARLAKNLGASFIQILEPRAAGNYQGKEVDLGEDQLQLLDRFTETLNYHQDYKDWPLITYHGWHQRQIGCFGAGNRFVYVDTDGDLHACPFCQKKSGNVLQDRLPISLEGLRQRGCHQFKDARL